MEKKDYFNKEYNYVKDTNKRNDLILLVSGLPDYFFEIDRKSTRLNSSHTDSSRMPSSA